MSEPFVFPRYDYPEYVGGEWRYSPDDADSRINTHENGMKGPGFATATDMYGNTITELSAGPKHALYPLVYEGITPWDMQTLVNVSNYGYDPLQNEVRDRAYEAALVRAMQGKPPFWTPEDAPGGLLYDPRPKNW